MHNAALAFAVAALLPAQVLVAEAHEETSPTVRTSCCDSPARWARRHDTARARLAVTTRDGGAVLLLTEQVVAMQLSDRTLHRVERKLRQEQNDDEEGALAQAIKTVILGSVRALLDHSAECPIRDLDDVEYRQGRLIFTTEKGARIFEELDVNDQDVMRSFSEPDARAFVREFRRIKARSS